MAAWGRFVCGAEGKVIEEVGESSGKHGLQEADASAMEESGTGRVPSKPTSPAEASSMQAGACEGSCDSAAGVVDGTPDQPADAQPPCLLSCPICLFC